MLDAVIHAALAVIVCCAALATLTLTAAFVVDSVREWRKQRGKNNS